MFKWGLDCSLPPNLIKNIFLIVVTLSLLGCFFVNQCFNNLKCKEENVAIYDFFKRQERRQLLYYTI